MDNSDAQKDGQPSVRGVLRYKVQEHRCGRRSYFLSIVSGSGKVLFLSPTVSTGSNPESYGVLSYLVAKHNADNLRMLCYDVIRYCRFPLLKFRKS